MSEERRSAGGEDARARRREKLNQRFGGRRYADPATWTTLALLFLVLAIGTGAWRWYAAQKSHEFLVAIEEERFATEAERDRAADEVDRRMEQAIYLQLGVLLFCIVFVLKWIHRSSSNVHAMGAKNLRFSPAGAVGWYFCPIANLWMPFQSMSEIWRGSKDPLRWKQLSAPVLLPIWWGSVLLSGALDRMAVGKLKREPTLEELKSSNHYDRAGEIVWIIAAIALILIIIRVSQMQRASHGARVVEVDQLSKVFE